MYHPKVIEKNLRRAEQIIARKHNLPARWSFKYPTPAERDEMGAHLTTLYDASGKLIRPFTREESLWALCERTLCKLDYHYYQDNYVKIVDWSGRVAPFRNNFAQQITDDDLAEAELNGLAQLFIDLKARQLGDTTKWQTLLSQRVFFYNNVGCVTGSAEPEKSRRMVSKLEFIHSHLPIWMRPRITAYRAGEYIEFGELGTTIEVVWGNQKKGMAKGMTAIIGHLSEIGEWLDPGEQIDASFIRTMHENPFSLLCLEGTAERMGDWWNNTWDFNVKMDTRGLARLKPRFFPWYLGIDIYPTPAYLRRRPIPADWDPPDYIKRHAEAAAAYVASDARLRKHLGDNWRLPLSQQWFYHLEYEEFREKRQLHNFFKMMPASPDQAWQNANPSVFDIEVLDTVRTEAAASLPAGVFQLAGASVPPHYNEYRIDPAQISRELRCLSQSGKLQETFTLEPLRLEAWPDLEPLGKVYIWEWPIAGETYGLGIDSAEGVDQDRSAIEVFKKATPWHPDEQVAEFLSPRVLTDDLWMWAFALAHLYTTPRVGSSGWIFPRVVFEINHEGGAKAQTEMLKRGWPEFHREYDDTRTGTTGTGAKERPRSYASERIGFKTGRQNRSRVISAIRKFVRDGHLWVRSPVFAKELQTLEYNLDRKRIEASEGNHDDAVMAGGILLASWYDPELTGTVPQAFRAARERERQMMEDPILRTWTPPPPPPPPGWKAPEQRMPDSRKILYG